MSKNNKILFLKSGIRKRESGNVLFLILIAVALFAALSYAVTQSSRSGSGNASSETNLVDSSQITQYPASVRTSIIRQMVSKNVTVPSLEFNAPSDFAACTGTPPDSCVFHPSGGAATYVNAPPNITTTGAEQGWVFNGENEINLVGTTVGGNSPSATSADIIAFLPNVKTGLCQKINQQLGINSGAIVAEADLDVTTQMVNGIGILDGTAGGTIGGSGATALDGRGFGCFSMGSVNYYYHVLVEQ